MTSVTSATSCSNIVLMSRHALAAVWSILFPLVLAALVGCGETSDGVSINGRVSYRGQPIDNGSLTFIPTSGRPVSAALSENGEYSAELPPGDYTVLVSVGTQMPPGWKEGDPTPKPKFVLPPEYTTQARSTLQTTVRDESDEPINFDLK